MRAKTANTPATIPTTAPLTSLVTFSVISAFASSISSRTSSEARSETSWIAWASSDVGFSSAMSVHQPLQDAGEDEGAGEGGADEDLGALGSRLAAAGGERRDAGPRGAGRLRGVGLGTLALGDALGLLGALARLLLLALGLLLAPGRLLDGLL